MAAILSRPQCVNVKLLTANPLTTLFAAINHVYVFNGITRLFEYTSNEHLFQRNSSKNKILAEIWLSKLGYWTLYLYRLDFPLFKIMIFIHCDMKPAIGVLQKRDLLFLIHEMGSKHIWVNWAYFVYTQQMNFDNAIISDLQHIEA